MYCPQLNSQCIARNSQCIASTVNVLPETTVFNALICTRFYHCLFLPLQWNSALWPLLYPGPKKSSVSHFIILRKPLIQPPHKYEQILWPVGDWINEVPLFFKYSVLREHLIWKSEMRKKWGGNVLRHYLTV